MWSLGAAYRFDRNWNLEGAYAENTKADNFKTAHNIQLSYKGANRANAGSWGMYAAYRYLGENVALNSTYDTFLNNTKGWDFGVDYTPLKNTYAAVWYFDGKQLANDKSAKVLYGRLTTTSDFWVSLHFQYSNKQEKRSHSPCGCAFSVHVWQGRSIMEAVYDIRRDNHEE